MRIEKKTFSEIVLINLVVFFISIRYNKSLLKQ